MRIKGHWQECIQEIREFKYLDQAMDPEFKVINLDTSRLAEDILVPTAPVSILSRYEKILDLEVEQDIDVRRSNILNKLSNRIPFTKWWLAEKLNTLLGKDNYTLDVFGEKFEIVIEVDMAFGHIFSSVQTQFLKQIPANMILTPKLKITAAVGVEILSKTYRFDPPICEYVTGVYPYSAYFGKIDERSLEVTSEVSRYLFDFELSGTKPYISILGKLDERQLTIDSDISRYLFDPEIVGVKLGIKPDISILGKIAYEEAQTLETRDVIPFSYKLCNTVKCGM